MSYIQKNEQSICLKTKKKRKRKEVHEARIKCCFNVDKFH